jgi:SAM-dependent methyltransferase
MISTNKIIDTADVLLCRIGLIQPAHWDQVRSRKINNLYAGRLSRGARQFSAYVGLTPFAPSTRNIGHDVTAPLPLSDGSIERYQSEDVFEHVPYEKIPFIFNEIHRVLKPGGLFRLSVPDYRCDVYEARSVRNEAGELVFDPGGGGRYEAGRVVDGGHLWFPTYELVKALFDRSHFADRGSVKFLHYTAEDGSRVMEPIDYALGYVQRTPDNDPRVAADRRPLSIVVDAIKR